MERKVCDKCGDQVPKPEIDYRGECQRCQRRRRDEDDAAAKRIQNAAMGDMLNTGILGGIDFDFGTPL